MTFNLVTQDSDWDKHDSVPFGFELVLPARFGSRFLFDFGLLWDLWTLSSLVGEGHPAGSKRWRERCSS